MKKQQKEIIIKWDDDTWKEIVNERFLPLVNNRDRYLIMYGGRGSSKSRFAATKVIYRMLADPFFRCLLVRNVAQTIKDSSYQVLVDVINDLGLNEYFECKLSPLEIICKPNGNKILCRGLDNPLGIKSISEICCVWYEEDIIDEEAFLTVSSSIRTAKATYIQEIFTINPEVEGIYTDNWFYKLFFQKNEPVKSFRSSSEVQLGKKTVFIDFTVHFSTYKDNRWVTDQYKARLENFKVSNPYYYTIYTQGNWGVKENKFGFYKDFERGRDTSDELKYNPDRILHISFDFNVNPYMSASVWQLDGLTANCINEITTISPNNNSKGICREILKQYGNHSAGLFIYGDCNGRHLDTRSEYGVNDYNIICGELKQLNPKLRVPSKNPSLGARGNFINSIFKENKFDISIKINSKCSLMINDLIFTKEAPDGTKLKEKTTKDGITFEKYGHLSDGFDYVICEAYKAYFLRQNRGGLDFKPSFGSQPFNEKVKY